MEYLDVYDENKNYIGKVTRDEAHEKGMWHNTVHCWLYDKDGNVYFQIRKDTNTFYTTASGHVLAGETIKEAFGREVKEEIGIDIDYNLAKLINIVTWSTDKVKKDGTIWKDRAFANVYACELNELDGFKFDLNEVNGLVRVNAENALRLFKNEIDSIEGMFILGDDNEYIYKDAYKSDFLIMNGENQLDKYGKNLKFIINLTSK